MAYIFDPEILNTIAKKAIGLEKEDMFDQLTADLAAEYPGHIETGVRRWMFSNAGGMMGEIALLHASLSEYVLLFAAPVATGGHSGRYRTHLWDFYLAGQAKTYEEGELDCAIHEAGDFSTILKGRAAGVEISAGTYVLEYARGPIPTMLTFGLLDSMFSTFDLKTIWRTNRAFSRLVLRELRQGKI